MRYRKQNTLTLNLSSTTTSEILAQADTSPINIVIIDIMDSTHFGKYANNLHTLIVRDRREYLAGEGFAFQTTIPQNGFPHKKRCMVMLESLTIGYHDASNTSTANPNNSLNNKFDADKNPFFDDPTVAVSVDGMGVMNSYDNINNQNGFVGIAPLKTNRILSTKNTTATNAVYENSCGNILTKGVLAQSPFGKGLNVRILDMGSEDIPLGTQQLSEVKAIAPAYYHIGIVLKILFLDDLDMKEV